MQAYTVDKVLNLLFVPRRNMELVDSAININSEYLWKLTKLTSSRKGADVSQCIWNEINGLTGWSSHPVNQAFGKMQVWMNWEI